MPAGRPRNAEKSEDVTITGPPKLGLYLDDLIAEQGFGSSRGEVAKTLVWQRVHSLITEGVLDRRRATPSQRAAVARRLAKSKATKRGGA